MKLVTPTLDGVPEPPPRWERPAEAVRMSALELDLMLTAALPHAATPDDDLAVLVSISLTIADGLLQVTATDRYTAIRERRPVNQTCSDFTFLLRRDDAVALRALLRALLRGLEKDERPQEPVDLFLVDDRGVRTLAILGADLDVRFTEVDQPGDYPDVDRFCGRALERLQTVGLELFDLSMNPTLLARLVPLQRAGRTSRVFRYRWSGPKTSVVVTTHGDESGQDDDVVVLLMPVTVVELEEPGRA